MSDKTINVTLKLKKDGSFAVAGTELEHVSSSAKKADASISSMTRSVYGFVGATIGVIGAKEAFTSYISATDQMKMVDNRLKLATESTEEMTRAQRELYDIAQGAHSAYAPTADLYSNMSRAAEDLHASQSDLLLVTRTVNESFAVSGAETAQVSAGVTQLSQALASGVLRGDEFNSIMENAPRLAKAMGDALGVSRGELRGMAEDGKLTSEVVFGAIKGQASAIHTEFSQMSVVVGQALVNVQNSVTTLAAEFDKAIGNGNDGIAGSLLKFSQYIDDNRAEIIDFGKDVIAGGTIVANGLESIYLASKIGYLRLTAAFPNEVEGIINTVIGMIESSLNLIQSSLNDAADYWNDLLGTNFGHIKETTIGRVSIDVSSVEASLSEAETKLVEVSASTDAAFVELATGAEHVASSAKDAAAGIDAIGASASGVSGSGEDAADAVQKLNDAIFGVTADDEEKIRAKWKKLIEGISDPELLKQAASAMQIEIEAKINVDDDAFKSQLDTAQKLQDTFDNLSTSTANWAAGLDGVPGSMIAVSNALKDISKEQQAYDALKQKTDANDIQHFQNQLSGYGNLAGAMSTFFAEGSKEAAAFQMVQSGLALVNAVSTIAMAGSSLPFPANIAAIATTAATLSSFLSQAGIAFGGGSGGGGPSGAQKAFETAQSDVKAITDRLDAQIDLLKAISLGGSASYGAMQSARTTAESLVPAARNVISSNVRFDVLDDMHTSRKYFRESAQTFYAMFAEEMNLEVPVAINKMDPAKFANDLATFFNTASVSQLQAFYDNTELMFYHVDEVDTAFENLTGYITDFADATLSTYTALRDAVGDWRDTYDSISGTDFFHLQDLEVAREKVGTLMSDIGVTTYDALYRTLGNIGVDISGLERAIVGENGIIDYDLLYAETIKVNDALQMAGISASYSAEDLLNMVDALGMVGDAEAELAQSRREWAADAADMYEQLTGQTHSTTAAFQELSVSFVNGMGGLQTVLDQVASNTLEMTSAQWEMVQTVYALQDISSNTATTSSATQINTAQIVRNTSTTSGYDAHMQAYQDRIRAEAYLSRYGDQFAGISQSDLEYAAAIGEIIRGASTKLPNYVNANYQYEQELNTLASSFGLDPKNYQAYVYTDYQNMLSKMYSDITGYEYGDAYSMGLFSWAQEFIGSLSDASDATEDYSSSLSTAANTFGSISDTYRSWIDQSFASSTVYTEAMLRKTMAQAAGLQQVIASGGDYTQSDLDRLQTLAQQSTSYASNFLASLDPASFEYRIEQNRLAHTFGAISRVNSANEKTMNDVVSALEKSQENEQKLIALNQQLLAALQKANMSLEDIAS